MLITINLVKSVPTVLNYSMKKSKDSRKLYNPCSFTHPDLVEEPGTVPQAIPERFYAIRQFMARCLWALVQSGTIDDLKGTLEDDPSKMSIVLEH